MCNRGTYAMCAEQERLELPAGAVVFECGLYLKAHLLAFKSEGKSVKRESESHSACLDVAFFQRPEDDSTLRLLGHWKRCEFAQLPRCKNPWREREQIGSASEQFGVNTDLVR